MLVFGARLRRTAGDDPTGVGVARGVNKHFLNAAGHPHAGLASPPMSGVLHAHRTAASSRSLTSIANPNQFSPLRYAATALRSSSVNLAATACITALSLLRSRWPKAFSWVSVYCACCPATRGSSSVPAPAAP